MFYAPIADDFYIGGNSLTGTLPAGMFTLQGMQFIDLSMNRLSGTFPSNVQEWKELKQLYLHNNSFSGPIPVEFGVLKSLGMLYDSFAQFSLDCVTYIRTCRVVMPFSLLQRYLIYIKMNS